MSAGAMPKGQEPWSRSGGDADRQGADTAPCSQHQAGERIEGYVNQGEDQDSHPDRTGELQETEEVEGREEIRMSGVVFDRKWVIKTQEDFDKAMDILEHDVFIANMSDSYARTRSEKREIQKQLDDVTRQAKEAGLM